MHRYRNNLMQKIRPRAILSIAVFIGVLLIGVYGYLRSRPSVQPTSSDAETHEEHEDTDTVRLSPEAVLNVGIRTQPAQTRPVTLTITTVGTIGPDETRLAHLRPLSRGRIQQVFVRTGDRVRRGQPLLIYDNIELGELVGDYLQAVAEAEVARRYLERAEQLVRIGALAQAEYDQREARYREAIARVQSIELKMRRFGLGDADLERLRRPEEQTFRQTVSLTTLRAPIDGVIIRIDAVPGEFVDPEDEVCTVADLSTVWVQARVYEKDLAQVQRGRECIVTVESYPDATFHGTITYVSDFLDPATRTAQIRCEVPNPDGRLRLEMFATIRIPISLEHTALMVPESAVQWIDDTPVVFVRTAPETFVRRVVELGTRGDGWVEIKRGLRAGEQVVSEGAFYLKSILLREQIGDHH